MPEYGGANSLGTTIEPTEIVSGSYIISTLQTDMTAASHTGDTVETTLSTLTVPANKVQQGILVLVDAQLELTSAHSANITNAIRVYAGPAGSEALKASKVVGIGSAQIAVFDVSAEVFIDGLTWTVANNVLVTGQLDADSVAAGGTVTVNRVTVLGM